MDAIVYRLLEPSDLPAVSDLFDGALGAGFWSLSSERREYCRVATIDSVPVGAAVAALAAGLNEAPGLPGPIGLIRLVAVSETARRRGLATQLVDLVGRDCRDAGATALASFAWVYGGSGICPLGGVLENLGFARRRRLESFYAGPGNAPCPACHRAPCVCSADLYVREMPPT